MVNNKNLISVELVDNCIIINGVHYVLREVDCPNPCDACDLFEECGDSLLCENLHSAGLYECYIKV